MAEPLKNIYNDLFFAELKTSLKKAAINISYNSFLKEVKSYDWDGLELKQRMRKLSTTLNNHLKGGYKEKLEQVLQLIKALPAKSNVQYSSLAYMYIPDFIEQFGLNDVDDSLKAMETINLFTSCEFAIRPYLLADEKKVMKQMLAWSKHKHASIRRFSSEGCRPRLPWATAIPSLKKDPAPILPILENLKNDTSVYVQKSVANNLNDISKDHPQLVIEIVKKWQGHSAITNWIIKHGCRGLLKSGHTEVLDLFGTGSNIKCEVKDFKFSQQKFQIGDSFSFEFKLKLKEDRSAKLRLEYAVYYQKANGSLSKKMFKINEGLYEANKWYSFIKKHAFKNLTTRKHHAGKHIISIVVNGKEYVSKSFMLTV